MSGRSLFTAVAVSFGLLCVVQVSLNIFLRLYLYGNLETCESVTQQRDELRRKLAAFDAIVEEAEELKRKLIDLLVVNASHGGWHYFRGSVYFVSSAVNSWNDSRDDCRAKGADLLVIDSREEQNFTRQLKNNMWIGLTARGGERTWTWVDGTEPTTSYWMEGEPNNSGFMGEDCGEVMYHELENNWNDELCEDKNFWICEKKV